MRGLGRGLLVTLAALLPLAASAEAERDRASAGGYFRLMTRPDLQGGDGRLGFWNLYGRLLNEGPWATLDLRLDLLQASLAESDPWTSVHARIEGGSVKNADPAMGGLASYRVSELYVKAGNVLLRDVTWQLGTLDSYFGDLGLYDLRPATVFFETVGLSARWNREPVELLVGVGDAGFSLKGADYHAVPTAGGTFRVALAKSFLVGVGGQGHFERKEEGNRFALHSTPGISYEDLVRGEVVQRYLEEDPLGQFDLDHRPEAVGATSWKAIGWIGFGELGPLKWNNLFASYRLRHPEATRTETFGGRTYTLYVAGLTDERTELVIGDEAQLVLWPGRLDAVLAGLYGEDRNADNDVAAGEDNRKYVSAVLRLQLYFTETLHLLCENSVARETSLNGNLFREHHDSVFRSEDGASDARGLEFGDTDTRDTWQLKVGPVLNPLGTGIFTRPSLRLLFGLQRSNVHNAFRSSDVESLDQYELFAVGEDRHWHSLVALEAEAWF